LSPNRNETLKSLHGESGNESRLKDEAKRRNSRERKEKGNQEKRNSNWHRKARQEQKMYHFGGHGAKVYVYAGSSRHQEGR
jgi:hypothetical protein